jgi:hypothetical protein
MMIVILGTVQQPYASYRRHGIHEGVNGGEISALTEIRDTFDESIHIFPIQYDKAGGRLNTAPASSVSICSALNAVVISSF